MGCSAVGSSSLLLVVAVISPAMVLRFLYTCFNGVECVEPSTEGWDTAPSQVWYTSASGGKKPPANISTVLLQLVSFSFKAACIFEENNLNFVLLAKNKSTVKRFLGNMKTADQCLTLDLDRRVVSTTVDDRAVLTEVNDKSWARSMMIFHDLLSRRLHHASLVCIWQVLYC